MTELFESTIDNVSELEVKGYSDPVNMERTMEIWAKRGDEEYLYKFSGPGVDKFEAAADGRCWKENKKLKEAYDKLNAEKKDLKKENEDFGNQILDYIEMNNKLMRENDELAVNAVAAKGKNKLLEIENEKLKKENERIKENLQSQHKMVVELNQENCKLSEENEELKEKYQTLKKDKFTVRLHDKDFTIHELVDRIFELEHLKTPTIENFADEKPSTRADILDQAKKCVCGQREQDYGTPESNFQLIADLWNGYLGFMDHPQDQIRATDVAMMMALMKIARIRNGGGSGDSFVDLAGYAACGGEIWHGERHSST